MGLSACPAGTLRLPIAASTLAKLPTPSTPHPLRLSRRRGGERVAIGVLRLCAFLTVATTAVIVGVLVTDAIRFFRVVGVVEFLTGTEWTALFTNPKFGVLPLLSGTVLVAAGAMVIALPLGVATAIYLSEYAPRRVRTVLKPTLELLAGIPTVVFGYFALNFVTPHILRPIFGDDTPVFNAAAAAIVVGLMTLPTISSLTEDAFSAVPDSLREAAYGLGAGKRIVALRVIVPAALSGIGAALLLGISRAVGETMAVAIAAGATPNLTWNPLESIQTMTGFIAQVGSGEAPTGSVEYKAIFAVGFTLFIVTLAFNIVSQRVVRRYRQVYQ